jgi:hypothetical protein
MIFLSKRVNIMEIEFRYTNGSKGTRLFQVQTKISMQINRKKIHSRKHFFIVYFNAKVAEIP